MKRDAQKLSKLPLVSKVVSELLIISFRGRLLRIMFRLAFACGSPLQISSNLSAIAKQPVGQKHGAAPHEQFKPAFWFDSKLLNPNLCLGSNFWVLCLGFI